MKQSFGVICLLMIIFSFTVSPSLSADEHDENWSKPYESYRQHFNPYPPPMRLIVKNFERTIE